ncbi:hypothetical protein [Robertmurraya massiliosenegalensis]|uniref:hypothetical protein n=1 Tax=Robertmurraya massiliosenegalensis TaxID=1287657 RepID=UPI00031E89DB|nr:hypothetical protein [Robertmurraya massiliosenegalensis]
MKKHLVFRTNNGKDYLYDVLRADNLVQAGDMLADKIIEKDLKDTGIYTLVEQIDFHYKENKVIFPKDTKIFKVFNPPNDISHIQFLNDQLKIKS